MGNLLTHGLLASAFMAMANTLTGIEPVSWNLFLAAIIAIALNLDSGDDRIAPGSPVCHSLGCGMAMVYLAGTGAYLAWAFMGMGPALAHGIIMAVGAGVLGHLVAETATGELVYTFPRNLRPESWLVKCDADSARFWPAWGRFSTHGRRARDAHLNGLSLAAILTSIWLF